MTDETRDIIDATNDAVEKAIEVIDGVLAKLPAKDRLLARTFALRRALAVATVDQCRGMPSEEALVTAHFLLRLHCQEISSFALTGDTTAPERRH